MDPQVIAFLAGFLFLATGGTMMFGAGFIPALIGFFIMIWVFFWHD